MSVRPESKSGPSAWQPGAKPTEPPVLMGHGFNSQLGQCFCLTLDESIPIRRATAQAPVVQMKDRAIRCINHYPVDQQYRNQLHYIQWIVIYPVVTVIPLLNKYGQKDYMYMGIKIALKILLSLIIKYLIKSMCVL